MPKPIAIFKPRKNLKIVIQTRLPKTTCNTVDMFAKEKGMSRSECLEQIITQAAEWIRQGHIK